MNKIFMVLFFLEMGCMKVFVRFEVIEGYKGDFFYLIFGEILFFDNYWYKVNFYFVKGIGVYLFIDDVLRGYYEFRMMMLNKDF